MLLFSPAQIHIFSIFSKGKKLTRNCFQNYVVTLWNNSHIFSCNSVKSKLYGNLVLVQEMDFLHPNSTHKSRHIICVPKLYTWGGWESYVPGLWQCNSQAIPGQRVERDTGP